MRWVVGISVLALLSSAAISRLKSHIDPLADWKQSVTEWPETFGCKEEFDPEKWERDSAIDR